MMRKGPKYSLCPSELTPFNLKALTYLDQMVLSQRDIGSIFYIIYITNTRCYMLHALYIIITTHNAKISIPKNRGRLFISSSSYPLYFAYRSYFRVWIRKEDGRPCTFSKKIRGCGQETLSTRKTTTIYRPNPNI